MSDRFTEQHQQKALDAAGRAAPLVLVIQFQGAGTYAPTLDSIVQWSGGRYEQVGAASGVANSLRKLLPDLGAPWLVTYETSPATRQRKLEVKVSRKGTKVRVRSAGVD